MIGRVLGCVVAFEPDEDSIAKVRALRAEVPELLVVDNSFSPARIQSVERLCAESGAQLLQNRENLGQAVALNQGCEWARDHGFEHVLFFDQDTRVLPGFLADYLARLAALPAGEVARSVVGCAYVSASAAAGGPRIVRKRTVITTGSLVPVALWQRVGGFRGDFFIDHVDDEFCLRVRRAGGSVWRIEAPLIQHRIGRPTRSRWALEHGAFRWYHMSRNHVWTLREHALFDPLWALHTLLVKARLVLGVLAYEREVGAKVAAMLRGLRDGVTTRPRQLGDRGGPPPRG